MNQTLIIPGTLTDLNTYINAERRNKFLAAKIKKNETERIYWLCKEQNLKPFKNPVMLSFKWIDNSKKDPDNLAYAKKFILDGMVSAHVIENDDKKHVVSFSDVFVKGDVPQIIVEVEEMIPFVKITP